MNTAHLINKCIRDKNNKIVLWQRPNLLIIGWFVCAVVAHLFHAKHLHTGFASLGTGLLFMWAYLEITQGASYFRRLLGLTVAITIIMHYFKG
jgi:hypothetical protein